MAEFVKKNALGLYVKPEKKENGKLEYSHVILTKKEYEDKLDEIDTVRFAKDKLQEIYEATIAANEKTHQSQVDEIKKDYGKQLNELQKELSEEQTECTHQRELNKNLLRICKERANADRKLKPKKEHAGYVVLSSRESEYKYKKSKHQWEKVVLWETFLQTPYIVEFTEEQARTQIKELFEKGEEGKWLISKIGISARWLDSYENIISDNDYNSYKDDNVVIREQLRANYTTGYWEVIIMHTKPLDSVPKDMMRCNYS